MKKLNKKGFTIVELVIVIAVIAILAAVLIPTFATVINKANESAAMQAAKNAYSTWLIEGDNTANLGADYDFSIHSGKYYFEVKDGTFDSKVHDSAVGTAFEITANGSLALEFVPKNGSSEASLKSKGTDNNGNTTTQSTSTEDENEEEETSGENAN